MNEKNKKKKNKGDKGLKGKKKKWRPTRLSMIGGQKKIRIKKGKLGKLGN